MATKYLVLKKMVKSISSYDDDSYSYEDITFYIPQDLIIELEDSEIKMLDSEYVFLPIVTKEELRSKIQAMVDKERERVKAAKEQKRIKEQRAEKRKEKLAEKQKQKDLAELERLKKLYTP
jgi:hypothetical protein